MSWGERARIKELEAALQQSRNVAALMLQEREFFAKQIRDIRAAWFHGGPATLLASINAILARENPMP